MTYHKQSNIISIEILKDYWRFTTKLNNNISILEYNQLTKRKESYLLEKILKKEYITSYLKRNNITIGIKR